MIESSAARYYDGGPWVRAFNGPVTLFALHDFSGREWRYPAVEARTQAIPGPRRRPGSPVVLCQMATAPDTITASLAMAEHLLLFCVATRTGAAAGRFGGCVVSPAAHRAGPAPLLGLATSARQARKPPADKRALSALATRIAISEAAAM